MQNKNNQTVIWTIVIVLILIGIGLYAYHADRALAPSQNETSTTVTGQNPFSSTTSQTATTTGVVGIGYKGSGTGSSTPVITVLGTVPANIPSLTRPITFPVNMGMSTTSQIALTAQMNMLETSLAKDPTNFLYWMQLATDRKVIQDYQGAAQAWVYASELSPTDYVSLGNLADLYGYYIHDNAEAETYYTAALRNGPSQDYLYFNAVNFYLQVENSPSKALALAQQGVQFNPGDQNLANLLASLQKGISTAQ